MFGRGRSIPFTGFVPVGSSQITLKHQFALMSTIGRTFGDVTLYAGGGPALFDIKSKIIDAVGFAFIDAHTVDVTGAPYDFSSDDWVWGGAGQVGATYFFAPRWFLDLNPPSTTSNTWRAS